MKQIQKKLIVIYWALIIVSVVFLILNETGLIPSGVLAGIDGGVAEFACQMVAVCLALAFIPLALKLLKFPVVERRVKANLPSSYYRWSLVRIVLLAVVLEVNALFYNLFVNSSFFWLAAIALLALAFVYPSMERCVSETETTTEA